MSHESVDNFNSQGFLLRKNFFAEQKLNDLCCTLLDLFYMQSSKIGEYRAKAKEVMDTRATTFQKLSAIVELMEEQDKEALYQVQKFLPSSQPLRHFFDKPFMEYCASVLGSKYNSLMLDGPALFVNRPNTQRLLYKWHSEAHYYPKRRRFLNVWFPIFLKKTRKMGLCRFA